MGQQQTQHPGSSQQNRTREHTTATGGVRKYGVDPCELKEVKITCRHKHEEEHGKGGEHGKDAEHGGGAEHAEAKHAEAKHAEAKHAEAKHAEAKHAEAKHAKAKKKPGDGKREAEQQPDGSLLLAVCTNGGQEPEEAGEVTTPPPIAGVSIIRGNPMTGDLVTLDAEMDGSCKAHPVWTITEAGKGKPESIHQAVVIGHKFVGHQANIQRGVMGIYWLRTVKPTTYKVVCTACNGHKTLTILAYPTLESKLEIDTRKEGAKKGHAHNPAWVEHLDTLREDLTKGIKFLEKWTGKDTIEVEKLLEGSLYMTNYWQENSEGGKVDWKAELGVEMTFLEMHVDLPIPNPAFVVSKVSRFFEEASKGHVQFEVGIFFRIGGEFTANIHSEWTNDERPHMQTELDATFTLGLVAKAELHWEENVAALIFEVHTTGTFKGKPTITDEPQIEVGVTFNWQPFGGSVHVELRTNKVQFTKQSLKQFFRTGHPIRKEHKREFKDMTFQIFGSHEFDLGTLHLLPSRAQKG